MQREPYLIKYSFNFYGPSRKAVAGHSEEWIMFEHNVLPDTLAP